MAKYPLITGNASAISKLDRPIFGSSKFFEKKITNTQTGQEYIYGIFIIESNGDAGTNLDLSGGISILDDSDTPVSDKSLEDATLGRRISAIQDALFCLSPHKKDSATTWSNEIFVGVQNSNQSIQSELTNSWLSGIVETALPSDYQTALTGPAGYLKVNLTENADGIIMDNILTNTAIFADAEYILPIYSHSFIEANPIPVGQYAAIVVKCDVSGGIFDTVKTHQLEIKHDGQIFGSTSHDDYLIDLNVTGINDFIFSTTFAGSAFEDKEESQTFFSTIKHIKAGSFGYSFYIPNSTSYGSWDWGVISYSADTDKVRYTSIGLPEVIVDSYTAFNTGDGISGILNTLDTSLINVNGLSSAWLINGESFNSTTLVGFDGSAVKSAFDVYFSNIGSFVNQSDNPIPTAESPDNVDANDSYNITFRQDYNSSVYNTSSVALDSETNLYPNFTAEDVKQSETITVNGVNNDSTFTKGYVFNYCVYPLFTYGTSAVLDYNKIMNQATTSYNPTSEDRVNSQTTVAVLNRDSGKLPPLKENAFYLDTFGASTVGKTKHNVTINCFNSEDKLDRHAINHSNAYYKSSENIEVYVAASENAPLSDTSGDQTLVVPNVNEQLHYTVVAEASSKSVEAKDYETTSVGANSNIKADGTYDYNFEYPGVIYETQNFKAPITSWNGGNFHGVNVGTDRYPYYGNLEASGQNYKIKSGYYTPRPLIDIVDNASGEDISFGKQFKKYFNYVGHSSVTPTSSSPNNGIHEYSTDKYTETSRSFTLVEGSNQLTHYGKDADGSTTNWTNLDSYAVGMELFGLEDYFNTRIVIKSVTSQVPGTSFGFITVGDPETDSISNSLQTVTTTGLTAEIGKPLSKIGDQKDRSLTASHEELARDNSLYGYDLSCINHDTTARSLVPGDKYVYSQIDDTTSVNRFNVEDEALVNKIYTRNASTDSATNDGILNRIDFNPVELGLQLGGQATLPSQRYFNQSLSVNTYTGDGTQVFYRSLDNDNLNDNNQYECIFKLGAQNFGIEDVFLRKIKLVDPSYIPKGHYLIKPDSTSPEWKVNKCFLSVQNNVVDFHNTPANSESKLITSDEATLNSNNALHNIVKNGNYSTSINTESSTDINIEFKAPANTTSGSYFQALEVTYYRNEAITQRSTMQSDSVRNFIDRRVWTSRILLQVEINKSSRISVIDADGSEITSNGSVNFGTINA